MEALANEAPRKALTSSASADWGSPEVVYRFADAVLRPVYNTCIDLDASSSEYWQQQWPEGMRPRFYLDGSSDERNTIHERCDWNRFARDAVNPAILPITAFDNPPGDTSGELVQQFWQTLSTRYMFGAIASLFWVGFSLEQLPSLQGKVTLDPLHPDACTIIPSRRARYRVHPQRMFDLMVAKIARKLKWDIQHVADGIRHNASTIRDNMPGQIQTYMTSAIALDDQLKRGDTSPVSGDAPTHASYFTILWHRETRTRRAQQQAMRVFLEDQAKQPRSLFERCRVIGKVD